MPPGRPRALPAYLGFLLANPRYLVFGFLLTFISSFGQTFFIGLFKERLLTEHSGLTHGSYGWWYSVATLSSAACLSYLGRRVDDVDLRKFTLFVIAGLTGACLLMSWAAALPTLILALFGLRLFGQGLLSHTANTATARYFDHQRGKALSFVNLGHPAGEALLPIALVGLLQVLPWRNCWQICAAVVACVTIPATLALLRGHGSRHAALLESLGTTEADSSKAETLSSKPAPQPQRQWTAGQVLKDPHFYLLLPGVLAPAFIMTGLLFHQDLLKQAMGWSPGLFASSFLAYSIAQVSTAPVAGTLVDRYGAQRLLPFYLVPMATVLALLALGPDLGLSAFIFMAGAGCSSGIAFATVGAIWPERYGVRHLGAIRSQVSVMMVISTAISPPLIGSLVDQGLTMRGALGIMLGYTIVASGLVALGIRDRRDSKA